MKPNVGLVASARQVASFFGLLGLMASPALAGDRALIDFIGFSADAKYFAFEEFGIQDGSGFAYSNIFVIDLETDRWVEGTPIRVRAESEDTALADIRTEAREQAEPIIAASEITVSADLIAQIGDGLANADAKSLTFGLPGYERGTIQEERHLTLSTFPTKSAEDCESYFNTPPLGYELVIADGPREDLLHRDEGTLPKSRSCPLDYRLYGVVVPGPAGPDGRGVVMVSIYPGGFEGPDRRFLAVPFVFW